MWSYIVSVVLAFTASKDIGSNEINTKAVHNFKQAYKEVVNERWTVGKDCYRASFVSGSVKYIVDFHLNGKWRNTIRIYNEPELAVDMRHVIKTAFVGCEIIKVNELHFGKIRAYFVKIRHDGTSKTVKVADGDVSVVEEFVVQ